MMMRVFLVAVLAFGFSGFVWAKSKVPSEQEVAKPVHAITVEGAYAYPTAPQQKNGAAFMVIKNTMPMPDKVIAVYSDVAERVELHTHQMGDGDVMMMREVENFEVPGGGSFLLEPMGHHIMLMGLKEQLKPGTKFRLTLDFEKTKDMSVHVRVLDGRDLK